MTEIGLFPLELVLLPGERVPLHIFEARYRELIGECLAEGSEFGLILQTDAGLREVGTRAAVVELIDTFEDGRLNVLVEGRSRFRLLGLTGGRPFWTAEVEPLADVDERSSPEEAERALGTFRRLVEVADAGPLEEPPADAPTLSFALAARVDLGPDLKQELLELRSERQRLARLTAILERAVEALARERELRARASGNGKVSSE